MKKRLTMFAALALAAALAVYLGAKWLGRDVGIPSLAVRLSVANKVIRHPSDVECVLTITNNLGTDFEIQYNSDVLENLTISLVDKNDFKVCEYQYGEQFSLMSTNKVKTIKAQEAFRVVFNPTLSRRCEHLVPGEYVIECTLRLDGQLTKSNTERIVLLGD